MTSIYILQDENYNAVGATFENEKAHGICREKNYTFRSVPFYKCDDTKITMIAGPIPKEYLPKRESLINNH